MSLVPCAALPLKLHHFFEFAGRATGSPFPIKDRAGIADHLGIQRARVTEWTQADDSKNRDVNMVQDAHVEALAELYARLAPGPILADEAYRYWRYVSAEVFRDGLFPRPDRRDLFRLLKERKPAVEIKIELRPEHFGMMDDMAEPALGIRHLERGRRFSLHVERVRGKSVYLLVEAPEGLFLHVPGATFDGILRKNPQRMPPAHWWRFTTDGPHRIITIELAADVPPFIRDPAITGQLSERDIDALVDALEDPGRVSSWTWGACAIHVGDTSDD
jgi:hypothetical protein